MLQIAPTQRGSTFRAYWQIDAKKPAADKKAAMPAAKL